MDHFAGLDVSVKDANKNNATRPGPKRPSPGGGAKIQDR
jgi:hypothetical protein